MVSSRRAGLALGLSLIVTIVGAPMGADGFLPAVYGGAISAPLPGQPVTLDPAHADRESELIVCGLLYDTLYTYRSSRRQSPHLAEGEPTISADGKTWKIRLRAGVTLHDGRKLKAAQIVASLRRVRRGPHAYLLAPVAAIKSEGA